MSKSSLKKKVLCSLLAASVFGVMYNPGAEAAKVNGQDLNDLKAVKKTEDGAFIITNESFGKTEDGKIDSKKFIFGQGDKIIIATDNNVKTLIADLKAAGKNTDAIRAALAKNAVVGVVGGEGQLDSGLRRYPVKVDDKQYSGILDLVNALIPNKGFDKIINIDTTGDIDNVVKSGDTAIIIGEKDSKISPVVIGVVGGDLSVNSGANGSMFFGSINIESSSTSITRNGNTNVQIDSGNVFGGVGGSAAVAVGNIKAEFGDWANIKLNGETTTTINGDSNLTVNDGASVAGWANGGLAMGIGGTATSIVNGNSNITIHSIVKTDGALDGITAGIAGGGAAVTTFGGKADTSVGNVNITIKDGLSAGIIGGGMAAAVDAAGLLGKGNNDGTSDITDEQLQDWLGIKRIPDGEIIINGAIEGGEATSKTGDTNITLIGTSSAAGIVGGGVAMSSHTYTVRPEDKGGELPEGYNVNDSFGSSIATAESGKTTITINVDSSKMTGEQKSNVINALKALKDTTDLTAVNAALKEIQDTGAVVGIVGGGVAVAHGSNRSNLPGNWVTNEQGAYSTAINTGAQINLVNGYAVGTFGGGMAVADNNALATAKTDGDIIVNIGNGTEAVGVFGNGLAYFTGSQQTAEGKNANLAGSANVVANNTTINVGMNFEDADGIDKTTTVDGIIGGGVAIDDSQADKVNATVKTEGTATINVFDGAEVNVMTLGALDGLAGGPQTNPDENLDMGNYLAAVKDAAGNVAIAGGGVAIGGGAESTVHEAEINIYGGTVKNNIIGGGVAVYGYTETDEEAKGAHVDNATINLYGGTVEGNVYAGGSASSITTGGSGYDKATATVDKAVINLAGTIVEGTISGQGVNGTDADAVNDSTLNVIGENTLTALVGESKISGFDNINFEENSVTKVKDLNNTTALIDGDGGTITVADSARLDVSELDKSADGNTYFVADDYSKESSLWGDAQLAYDRTEGYAVTSDENGDYKVTYKDLSKLTDEEKEAAVDDAVDSFGKFGGNARGIIDGIIKDGASTNEGAKDFIGDLTSSDNQAEVEQGLYTGMMIGEDSGVTSNAVSMAQDFADNALLRLSFTQDTVNANKVGEEGGVWAKYLHNKHEVNGMNSSFGALTSSSDYDGVMVGAELAKKGNMQAGIAFAYGEGDGSGLTTKNDFDMWGISLYGNVKNDDINIIGDLGFSKSSNDITGKVLDNEFNADRDLNIFTVGVRAEKLYTNGNTQIVPYAGLRYMSVDADSYSTTYKDGKAFDYDAERQNIWTLPLGVSLRNETVTNSGWTITPKVDLAYIWAFGDTDNDVTVNAGSGASVLSYDVMDSGSWLASVGVDAGKGDWSYGLSYTLQKGSDVENNKWFVNVNYSF